MTILIRLMPKGVVFSFLAKAQQAEHAVLMLVNTRHRLVLSHLAEPTSRLS